MFLNVPESAFVPLEELSSQRARRMDEDVNTGSRYIFSFLIRVVIIGWTVKKKLTNLSMIGTLEKPSASLWLLWCTVIVSLAPREH
jgi:hypothetical protein